MSASSEHPIGRVIGRMPYRMALAGGWIDQPFVSRLNPDPTGSMVTVMIEPEVRFMDRSGMATGTRQVALRLWKGRMPKGDPAARVRELYAEENQHLTDPSGSQDMIGLLYPGINRLDYTPNHEGGYFPAHIESNHDPRVARWLEKVIHMIPLAPRPPGYSPLGEKHLDPRWVRRLGRSGRDCYDAILARDTVSLGASMNECMACWAKMLPHVVRHPTITMDLAGLLRHYQQTYAGAMFSGCGGGYLYVVSETPVPGAFKIKVRLA
jgi:hypothetical protein